MCSHTMDMASKHSWLSCLIRPHPAASQHSPELMQNDSTSLHAYTLQSCSRHILFMTFFLLPVLPLHLFLLHYTRVYSPLCNTFLTQHRSVAVRIHCCVYFLTYLLFDICCSEYLLSCPHLTQSCICTVVFSTFMCCTMVLEKRNLIPVYRRYKEEWQ